MGINDIETVLKQIPDKIWYGWAVIGIINIWVRLLAMVFLDVDRHYPRRNSITHIYWRIRSYGVHSLLHIKHCPYQ